MHTGNYEIKKIYFKINEVADVLGVSTALIRFWEKELELYIPKRKGNKNTRIYQQKHIDVFQNIKKLIREDKYTLKGVKNLIKKRKQNPLPIDMITELKEAKSFLQIILNKMKK
ncbi:MAG: MerR family transcriptional regulator [Bacteroidetes bacterium]|nr:MerR family transcriptional regulator [Bacteroidota bacterium]